MLTDEASKPRQAEPLAAWKAWLVAGWIAGVAAAYLAWLAGYFGA